MAGHLQLAGTCVPVEYVAVIIVALVAYKLTVSIILLSDGHRASSSISQLEAAMPNIDLLSHKAKAMPEHKVLVV